MSKEFPTAQMSRNEANGRDSRNARSAANNQTAPGTTKTTRESLEVSAFYDCLLQAYGGNTPRRRD
jgi:hypothetical protein